MKENIKKGLIFMLTLVLVLCQNGFLVQAGEITEPEDINQMIAGDYPLNSEVEIIIENEGYIYEDDDVKVRVEAKSDIENTVYEYCFAEKEQKDYKLLREFDDDNEYIFSAGAAGSYVLRVLLRMEDGTLSMQEKSYEVLKKEETVTDNSEKEQESESFQTEDNSKIADSGSLVTESESIKTAVTLSVSADKSGTQPSGSVVTLTGKAGGGSGSGYEYRFTETYNGNATTVQNYSEDPSYEYTAKGNGTHKFTVAVRDSSGNAISAVYTVEVKEAALTLSVSADKSGTQPSGSVVTLTGKAGGGSGSGYEYRFTETYNGNATTVQNYSEDPSYEYTAKGNGTHKFTVAVRDSSGNAISAVYTVEVKEAALTLSVSADKSGTQPSGSVVTLTGKAGGGSGSGYEYRFTETYNGNATTVQNYSEDPSYEYTAKGNGTHKFTVAVRDSSGNAISAVYTVEVKETALTVSLSSSKGELISEGAETILEAKVFGGSGDYKYCFREYYSGSTSVVQEYSSKEEYTFVADPGKTGLHEFTVEVEDSVGNSATATYSITVNLKPLTLSVSSNRSTNEVLGTQIMLTATAGAGDGAYEYRFTETYEGIAETKQAYSEKNTYSFTAVGIGEHTFTVAVKDSAGRSMSAVYKLTVEPEAGKKLFVSVESDQPAKVQDGTEITLVASSSGGYGGTQYRFTETYQGNSVTKQAYSENNTYSFQINGLGTHKFTIAAKDKEGQSNSASYLITVYSDKISYGIDVSAYQGDIDWSKVRNDGISFAMIRVLTGKMGALDVDPYFNKNIAGATKNGIAVGIYRYGYAMTPEQAQREAKMAIEAIKDSGYNTTYPIAYDVEDLNTQGTLSKDELTEIIKAFRGVVENNGYQFMIYSSKSWLETKIDMDEFADVDVWLARWFNDKTPNHDHGYNGPGTVTIWQYSDVGRVSGISGYVDMNVGYKSY